MAILNNILSSVEQGVTKYSLFGIEYTDKFGASYNEFPTIFPDLANWSIIIGIAIAVVVALMSVPMHYVFAIIMGAFLSLGWFDKKNRKVYLSAALILPIIVHGAYDTLCFSMGLDENLSFYILVAFLLGFKYIRRYVKSLTNSMLKLDGVES